MPPTSPNSPVPAETLAANIDHWNFRVVLDAGVLTLREVYYDAEGRVLCWKANAAWPLGADVDDLSADIVQMQRALDRPVLREEGDTLVEVSS